MEGILVGGFRRHLKGPKNGHVHGLGREFKMKRITILMLNLLLLITLSLQTSELWASAEATQVQQDTFACFCLDEHGNPLKGYWSDRDQVWYLFVTSVQDIPDVVLNYFGEVIGTSSGKINAKEKTVTGAFAETGDRVELQLSDGTQQSVIVMQSLLPSVYVKLTDTTLEKIHENKDTKHLGNSIYIMDPAGEYDLAVEDTLEIKGRGNSTWTLCEKKAYQIKFDEKTSVMGMGAAKKWVLLANAVDDSLMRNQLVYRMASGMDMAFVPSLRYVDLWIDGDYLGNYLLGDKIELGSTRLDLQEDSGVLFEHDEGFYMEEDHWFLSKMLNRHFALKEIVEEEDDIITLALEDFQADVDRFVLYLMTTPSNQVTMEDLSAMIDVDSFIKYYLINEYTLNHEGFVSSFYWYTDGPEDVIHLGPIWDFDTCLGNEGSANTDRAGSNHVLFNYLLAVPDVAARAEELKIQYQELLWGMTEDVDVLKEEIQSSAQMNYVRWDVLGKANPKGGPDFQKTFEDATTFLREWLRGRETNFEIPVCAAVTSQVTDDCYGMELSYHDGQEHSMVNFAVWSMDKSPQDAIWYNALQDDTGNWVAYVDLSKHNSAGVYRIDAYMDGATETGAMGYAYVEIARESPYHTNVVVSEDCRTMTITMDDSGECEKVNFAVWSEIGGQDDLQWYKARQNKDGIWEYTVPMELHHSSGLYYIHCYSGTGDQLEVVDYHNAEVPEAVTEWSLAGRVPAATALLHRNAKVIAAVAVIAFSAVLFVNYRRKKRRN